MVYLKNIAYQSVQVLSNQITEILTKAMMIQSDSVFLKSKIYD